MIMHVPHAYGATAAIYSPGTNTLYLSARRRPAAAIRSVVQNARADYMPIRQESRELVDAQDAAPALVRSTPGSAALIKTVAVVAGLIWLGSLIAKRG